MAPIRSIITVFLATPLSINSPPIREICTSTDITTILSTVTQQTHEWNIALQSTNNGTMEAEIIMSGAKQQLMLVRSAERENCTAPTDNQDKVCEAIREFAILEEQTLYTVKSKNSTVIGTPKYNFSYVLQYDEDAINSYLFRLVGTVPECIDEIAPQVDSLVASLKAAVNAYSEY
ncbi:hypothetical protein N7456_005984 [Penicillium angulare]|uniref:Uncharacterized protein n=1 Tax=Penicillium angulare TaxID=116970 RepID=A0A9W9FZJ0_9EURO|nr:hypothetical protein N7456_005984 [Penicillium angulare]